MKTKYIILPLVALGLAVTSCKDEMDYHEYGVVDKDFVELNFGNVGGFMTQLYKAVPYDFGNFSNGAMQAGATDEAEYSKIGNAIEDFYNGGWTPTNAKSAYWSSMYTAIQAANHYIDFFQGLDFDELKLNSDYAGQMHRYENYVYEARFLRAYFYFILNRQYGGVPIIDHQMSAAEINSLSRNTSDEVFEFIINECSDIKDKIIRNYADLGDYAITQTESGRAGKIAVLALRAQAALY
ncbi:MAG: RagB/SusD family nutrient uptake outer membrane protein, partial [Duncaniella sp.]|nr:RagB/SusD family nutrient uptake outer membrane protein [Duncaniella sp.]